MLHKSRGIVLNFIKYRETSIVTRIYTEAFGLQSYIVNSVRGGGKKSKAKISFFQPLTLLDLVVYYKNSPGLNRISDIKCLEPYQSIPYDFRKSGIAMFITEVLNKSLKEEEGNAELFEFLYNALLVFDHLPQAYENFHLQFMIKLSRYLGFAPQSAEEVFEQVYEFIGKAQVSEEEQSILSQLIDKPFTEQVRSSNSLRRLLLDDLVKFYQLHIDNFGDLKSTSVLREMME
ncbi:MAG: DNA repair protein RecO [Cyclobacteriaceae bacterium]